MALPFWLKSFCHVSEKIWKFFFLPPRFVLPPCLVHQWASIASFLRRLRGRCLWRHQQLWLRAAWTLFTMWKPSWRKTMFLRGLWTPRIGRWLPRWWKIPTMRPHTFCRASMLWIWRVQLPTCRTLSIRWLKPWKRWSWGRLPMALKPPPGRRAWLPLRRSPLGMRHLWMTRWWSRPHTNGRSLAEVHLPPHSSWQMFPSSMRRWPWTSSRWWTSSAPRRSMTCLSSSATRRSSQLWALDVWSRPMWRWRPRRSMMRSWSNHMFQAAPVQGWAVIPCGRTPNLILLQHTNAQNALRIGPPNGIPPRRGCASVGRRCCQSRRPSTWWTWTTPAATGCSLWLGMASHGCEMGSPRRMQRLPTAMSHPNRTRISNWGMRWILECWQKPHCAQLIMPRPACRIFCRVRTGFNFALRYFTESLMLRPSHRKLRPGLRSPRTARRNRQLWCSTLMLLQPWPWPASWLGQMSHQKKLSIRRDQRLRCWRWCRIMPISCMTCRVALCQWRIRRGRRHCGIWIWSSLRRFWRGSSWRGPGSNQNAWEALNRSMVDLDTAKAKNREYEEARRAYKQFLTPPPGTPSIWGENLQQLIEAGFFCPLTGFRKPSPGVGSVQCHWGIRQGEAHDCRASTTGLSWQALDWGPPVPTGHACGNRSPWQVIPHGGQKIGARISRSQGGPSSSHDQHVWWRDPTTCWQVEKIWIHGGPNLGQATPANLGRCAGIGTPHTPQRSRIQLLWSSTCTLMRSLRTTGVWNCAPIGPFWRAASSPMNLRLPTAVSGSVGRRKSRHGPCLLCWGSIATNSPWSSCGMPGRTSPLRWKDIAEDNVVVERKELKTALLKGRRSRRRPWISWNRCSCQSQPRWRNGVWFGEKLGHCWQPSTSSATRRFPVMDLPVADVVDSKEQLRFRAMCDERISFPFEELRPFEEVYAKLEPYVQSSSYVEVKVAWRCNTEQWWWARGWPCPCWASLSQVELLRWGHSGFWSGSRPASWGPCVGCSCRRRWLLDKDSFADGISWSATPRHHRWKYELCDGQGFQKEGGGKRQAHLLGQNWVWTGPEFRHPLGNH